MYCSADVVMGVLYQKIRRDYSARTAELYPLVPRIAAMVCGMGDTEEEVWDNAIAVLVNASKETFPADQTKSVEEKELALDPLYDATIKTWYASKRSR